MATPFFHIFIHADVVNAQSWEVSPQKNPVEQPEQKLLVKYSFNFILQNAENQR